MILPHVHAVNRTDENRVVLNLAVGPDHPAFDGHFPGRPILPGVVQLDWVIQLGVQFLALPVQTGTDFRVKFRRIIQPEAALSLTLWLDRTKGILAFEYRIADELASTGRVRINS